MQWLKHAFALDSAETVDPSDQQRAAVDAVCRQIVRRRLTTPALIFLEMSRPLNYLSAQAMHFFMPLVAALTDSAGPEHFARFLEHRGSIDFLCRRIEELESQATRADTPPLADEQASPPDEPGPNGSSSPGTDDTVAR